MSERRDHLWKVAQEAEQKIDDLGTTNPYGIDVGTSKIVAARRKGKDIELRQMAKFLAEKARDSGLAQEIGPLNPYERRIVHLAVAEVESVSSESIGDAFEKTVIISVK